MQNTVIKNLYCSPLHFCECSCFDKARAGLSETSNPAATSPGTQKTSDYFLWPFIAVKSRYSACTFIQLGRLHVTVQRQRPAHRTRPSISVLANTRSGRLHAPLLRLFPSASFTAKKANFVPHTLFPLLS
ncbi:unnamed protein product, partial [Ixodes pacificus]